MDFTAIDFETANGKRTSICSVGIAVVKNNKISFTKNWIVKPYPHYFSKINTDIHGISESDVESARAFDFIWGEISPYITNSFIVAHNTAFDVDVLVKTLMHYSLSIPDFEFACTCNMAKSIYPDLQSHRLNTLCKKERISLNHHEAESDAIACAKLFIKMVESVGIQYLDEIDAAFEMECGSVFGGVYTACSSYLPRTPKTKNNPKPKRSKINEEVEVIYPNTDLEGINFVFTGELLNMSREKSELMVRQFGANVQSSVTKSTNYLVYGAQNPILLKGNAKSSKQKKAEEYITRGIDIAIIDENEFIRLICECSHSAELLGARGAINAKIEMST